MPQVLIVQDDDKIRTSLVRALTDHGHAVSSAHTAMGGLRQAVEDRPHVVVLDLGLPTWTAARSCACCGRSAAYR